MIDIKTLLESVSGKTAVLIFGRFNPPTSAHIAMIDFANQIAQSTHGDLFCYVSTTVDGNKNPLNVDQKIKFMKLMSPSTHDILYPATTEKTFLAAATKIYNDGYTNLIMVCGGDRATEFEQKLNLYNNNLYKFDNIEVVSYGTRDPDSDGITGMSSTKLRSYAKSGDLDKFMDGMTPSISRSAANAMLQSIQRGIKNAI
jgi:phosphopantetheine adenylyltransferase